MAKPEKSVTVLMAVLAITAGVLIGFMSVQEPEATVIEEIQKTEEYCQEHLKPEHIWYIEGRPYLVEETPRGYHEIVGLYDRFHKD